MGDRADAAPLTGTVRLKADTTYDIDTVTYVVSGFSRTGSMQPRLLDHPFEVLVAAVVNRQHHELRQLV